MGLQGHEGNETRRQFLGYDYSDRPVVKILTRLDGVRPSGAGYLAQCPAHADRNPSLSVTEGTNGQALVYCHAGCDFEDILETINLDVVDLQPRLRAGRRHPAPPLPDFYSSSIAIPAERMPPVDRSDELHLFRSLLRRDYLDELGRQLGVRPAAFDEFDLGFTVGDAHGECFIIPERDAQGTPIGLLRRYADGSKLMLPGSRRGLIIPRHCFHRPGPLLVPEGFSDTVVLSVAGFPAVGRPSATGGTESLVGLLASVERDVVILGENDRKEDGRWPGREGAERVAAELTARLSRNVKWMLPPAGCKDARSVFDMGGSPALQHWLISQNT